MGFFERNLGALGERVDEGLEHARERSRSLCEREGWSAKAAAWREAGTERAESTRRWLGAQWRGIGGRGRRLLFGAALFLVLLVATALLRRLISAPTRLPDPEDVRLVQSLQSGGARVDPWDLGSSADTPWTNRSGR